jgi:hypothetical protein
VILKKRYFLLLLIPILSSCSVPEAETDILNTNFTPKPTTEYEYKYDAKEKSVLTSPLTGLPLRDEKINNQHFGVMIENSPMARPQSGLSLADIVYEIKTEGDISRYLAVFHDNIPKTIGPIRSSRHYFIPLAENLNTPYIHFGASTYAYDYLSSDEMSVPHIDGIKENQYFTRDNSRIAPHNAYLDTTKLTTSNSLSISNRQYNIKKINSVKDNLAKTIKFSYNNFTNIEYVYNQKDGKYHRFQEGVPHLDKYNNEQIKVKNIIFQFAKHEKIKDDKYGRIDVSLSGKNAFYYFSDGVKVVGNWVEDGLHTVFYTEDGEKLNINPGNTWIQVIDVDSSIHIN